MPSRLLHGLLAGALVATSALSLAMAPAQATGSADKVPEGTRQTGPHVGLRDGTDRPRFVPGEVLVRFAAGASSSDKAAARRGVGGTVKRRLPIRGLELLKVQGGVKAAVAALEKRADVAYAEPNYLFRAAGLSDDPLLPQQWGLHNTGQPVYGVTGTKDADIDAPEAWSTATGSDAVTVAVVDTGIDADHPELADRIWTNPDETANGVDDDGNGKVDDLHGWDFVEADNDPDDVNGHGTHVAGTIGASGNDGIGVTGVAWDVSLMPLRVLGPDGGGTSAELAAAFAYAGAQGADVVNASLEGGENAQAVADAIAGAPDTLFVVAAGNSGTNNSQPATPVYPCNYPAENLLCVAASDNQDDLAPFSNYSTYEVDLAAPGVGILSTVPGHDVYLSASFDSGLGGWTTGGTSPWGTEPTPYGPALSDSPGKYYTANANTWVQAPAPVDLTGAQGCRVAYWLNLETETGYDFLRVEASTTGTTWSEVARWSGSTGGEWYAMEDSLASYDGAGSVYLRYRLTSDSTVHGNGAKIDDVEVRCAGDTYDGDEYAALDGTSMATPHVAGAAALLYSVAPNSSVATIRKALLDGVDVKPGLGDTATGGRLNAARSLGLLTPAVGFAASAVRVQENVRTVNLRVVRSGKTDVPATVAYARTGGTAAAGSDFKFTAGTLSFAPGETAKTVPVTVVNDVAREAGETVVLSLTAKTPGTRLTTATTRLTIAASDQRPDMSVSLRRASGYVGNDIYNTTGRKQTRTRQTYPGGLATFFVRAQNDGNVTNTLRLKAGARPAGTRVSYLLDGRDVTRAMRSRSGLAVRLAPGRRTRVTTVVKVLRTAAVGTVKTAAVSATWTGDGTRTDVVKARVKVVR